MESEFSMKYDFTPYIKKNGLAFVGALPLCGKPRDIHLASRPSRVDFLIQTSWEVFWWSC